MPAYLRYTPQLTLCSYEQLPDHVNWCCSVNCHGRASDQESYVSKALSRLWQSTHGPYSPASMAKSNPTYAAR